jgi:hypothetical protein
MPHTNPLEDRRKFLLFAKNARERGAKGIFGSPCIYCCITPCFICTKFNQIFAINSYLKIKMNDKHKIRRFIRPQILYGVDTQTIFVNICREFAGYEPDLESHDAMEPKRFAFYDYATEVRLRGDSRLAYRILCDDFKKACKSLEARRCPTGKVSYYKLVDNYL